MILALTLLSLGCILAYTLAVCFKFKGIPNSISASFYSLEHKWWFRFTMWITPLLLMPSILELSSSSNQWLAFLSCVGMIIVGYFPDYINDSFSNKGHIIGATITMLASQIWVATIFPLILLIWGIFIIFVSIKTALFINKVKNKYGYIDTKDIKRFILNLNPLFWVEIICLINVYLTLFIIK